MIALKQCRTLVLVAVFCSLASRDGICHEIDQLISNARQANTSDEKIEAIRRFSDVNTEAARVAVVLGELTADADAEVRIAAVEGLAGLVYRNQLPFPMILGKRLHDDDPSVRESTVDMVGFLGEQGVPSSLVPRLIELSSANNPRVRRSTMTALGYSQSEHDLIVDAICRQAVFDSDPGVRMNAIAAVGKRTGDLSFAITRWLIELELQGKPADPKAHDQMQNFIPTACAQVIRNLSLEQPAETIQILLELLNHASLFVRAAAVRSIGALAQDSDAGMKAAIEAGAEGRIQEMLDDPEERVRTNVTIALEYFDQ